MYVKHSHRTADAALLRLRQQLICAGPSWLYSQQRSKPVFKIQMYVERMSDVTNKRLALVLVLTD